MKTAYSSTILVAASPTVTEVVRRDELRAGVVLTNLGAVAVFYSTDSGVSTTNGHRLAAVGGTVQISGRDFAGFAKLALYATASGGSAEVHITESFE